MIPVAQAIAEARRMVGVRYVHQGRSIGVGVDCLGMGVVALEHAGLDVFSAAAVPRDLPYGLTPSPIMLETLTRSCRRLKALQPGAMLLFKMPRTRHPHHLGIYTDAKTFVHADGIRARAVVEQTFGAPWTRFLHSMWAIPGVEYPGDG